jgi:hypothetical protein
MDKKENTVLREIADTAVAWLSWIAAATLCFIVLWVANWTGFFD